MYAKVPKNVWINDDIPDNRGLFGVSSLILSSFLKFLEINILNSSNKNPKFLRFKSFNDTSWYNPVESSLKGRILLNNRFIDDVVSIEHTVVFFIVITQFNWSTIFNKLFHIFLSKRFKFNNKIQLQIVYILLSSHYMFQCFVCFRIYLSYIFNCLCTWFILIIFYQ